MTLRAPSLPARLPKRDLDRSETGGRKVEEEDVDDDDADDEDAVR